MSHHDLLPPGHDRADLATLAGPIVQRPLAQARSWNQLHERMGEVGLQITRQRDQLMIGNGSEVIPLAKVSRVDMAQLEERFGYWHSAIPLYHPEPGRWDDIVRLRGLGRGLASQIARPDFAAARELHQIVERVGWPTAVRALPVAQLQAVRLAVGVSRQALTKILDPDLGRDR